MSLDYINEAFKKLDLLNEEAFDTSLDGINQLSDFMEQDDAEDIVKVIDPEAEFEDELSDSYIGKVITNCNVCHSHIFENKEDIVIDDEGVVNPDKQCPYCGEIAGFVIVGEITEFVKETDGEQNSPVVTVDGETVDESILGATAAGLALGAASAVSNHVTSNALNASVEAEDEEDSKKEPLEEGIGGSAVLDRPRERDLTNIGGTIADVLKNHRSEINDCGANETAVKACITRILSSDEVKDPNAAAEAIRKINSCRGPKLWSTIGTYMTAQKVISTGKYAKNKLNASIDESVNNVNVETDDSIVNVQSDEGGKVTVSTEPKEPEITDEEAIGPLSDETIADIENANGIEEEPVEEEPVEEEPTDGAEEGEQLEEGIFGFGKSKKKSSGSTKGSNSPSKVTFKIYDGNGSLQFNRTFDEIPGKKSAAEQLKDVFMDSSVYNDFRRNSPRDWFYERESNPSSPFDTKNKRGTQFLHDIGIYESLNSTNETDVDIDEMDEASFDELGESYLKNVYENVESFNTTSVSTSDSHLVVEGIIRFKSGVKKKTGFIFEAHSATPDGKVRFVGKNEHLSRGNKSFVLTGRVESKKLMSESFTYNYRVKNSEGKSGRVYGTVRKK